MATNVPPAPAPGAPKKKTSPLVWILIAIVGFIVLAIVGVTAVGFFAYHKAKQAGFDVALLEKKPELALLKMAVAANPDAEIVSIDEDRGIASVKNKKTGKVVTLNFEDIKNGKLTFEEDGQKVTLAGGDNAVKLPSWLPAYAGATMHGIAGEGPKGSAGGFSFKTADPPEKVAAFYEDELKKAGLTAERKAFGSTATVTAEDGGRKASVTVIADGTGSEVSGTFSEQ
ncbi:MAG: hypothetical protein ACM336_05535 [Acidobacteriota bacterium]